MTTALVAMVLARTWNPPTLLTQITNAAVNESSGIGASTKYNGVYYTHNDSGDSARFFRFKKDGTASIVTVNGASALDWEDMACVKVAGKNQLYFADIGDNLLIRGNVKVYRFEEPALNAGSVSVSQTYTITYPNGARNCEAMIVDPATGDIYFATKADDKSEIYRLAAPSQSGTYQLTLLGTIFPDTGGGVSGKRVTAGDADPLGRYVILRTYSAALEYKVTGAFQDWWKQTPTKVMMPNHAQGESIAYGQGGKTLVSSSEGSPCPVHIQNYLEQSGQ